MAWKNPQTWVAGNLVTANDLNTHLRDNLNYLHTGRPLAFKECVSGPSGIYTTTAYQNSPMQTPDVHTATESTVY